MGMWPIPQVGPVALGSWEGSSPRPIERFLGGEWLPRRADSCREPRSSTDAYSGPKASRWWPAGFDLPRRGDSVRGPSRSLDLNERHADVRQSVGHRRVLLAQSSAEPLDQTADGIDSQRRGDEIHRIG